MGETAKLDAERELVDRARDGCPEAFGQLVRTHQGAVRWFLHRYLHRDPVIDDLAQEVFLDAMHQIQQLRDGGSVRSWLIGIARNKAVSYLRRQRVAREALREIHAVLDNQRAQRLQTSASFACEQGELLSTLEQCVAELKPRSRRLIQAFYFQGQAAETIARAGGQQSGAVRMSLLRIRRTLARCLHRKLGKEFEL